MIDAAMTRKLREFIASVDRPRIYYDFGADRSLCQYVIDGFKLPAPKRPISTNLRWQHCDDMQAPVAQWWASHPEDQALRHHALADAHALRRAYLSLWGI